MSCFHRIFMCVCIVLYESPLHVFHWLWSLGLGFTSQSTQKMWIWKWLFLTWESVSSLFRSCRNPARTLCWISKIFVRVGFWANLHYILEELPEHPWKALQILIEHNFEVMLCLQWQVSLTLELFISFHTSLVGIWVHLQWLHAREQNSSLQKCGSFSIFYCFRSIFYCHGKSTSCIRLENVILQCRVWVRGFSLRVTMWSLIKCSRI